ncbi:hypothetical protein KOW79_006932, partial [Hemibagrus wyckioides]
SPKAVVSITPDTHVFVGESVALRCNIQGGGDTQWTYSWKKNNNKLKGDRLRKYTDNTNHEFRIMSVDVMSDSGTYTCRGHGRDSQSSEISDAVTLTVSAKPKPTVRVNPQSSVYTGDSVTLSCELQQGTGWGFYWYKNNQLLENFNSEQENTLKVTEDNAGETEYKCKAFRRKYYKEQKNYSTELSVPVKITVRASGPSGVEAPFSVLMLICSVVTVSPYLLVTIILLLICYRARAHTDEDRIENAVIEE